MNSRSSIPRATVALIASSLSAWAWAAPEPAAAASDSIELSALIEGEKLAASIHWANLVQTYDGAARAPTVTTEPAGLPVRITYDGAPTAPVTAGAYHVVATVDDAHYAGSSAETFVVTKAKAVVTLSNLVQPYDGAPKPVTVSTIPVNLPVKVNYDGNATPPVFPGAYAVSASIIDPNYSATDVRILSVTVTALARRAPVVAGGIDGSLQVLSPEDVFVDGSGWIAGDLLVPGTPRLRLGGLPMIAGSYDGDGAAKPGNHVVTLTGQSVIRYLVRRTDPLPLPTIAPPVTPSGTRSVTLGSPDDVVGEVSTIRDLAILQSAGERALPAGNYGQVTLGAGAALVLGGPDSAEPAVYNLQRLSIGAGAILRPVGPVVLVVEKGVTIDGEAGEARHPGWLTIAVANGGLMLARGSTLVGCVVAPRGTVLIDAEAMLVGEVVCDTLWVEKGGVLAEP